MFKLVSLQVVSALVGVLIGAAMMGLRGAVSAGLAGLVCVAPSLMLASYLKVSAKRPGGVQAMTLLFGEAFKIFLTIALLLLLPWVYPGLLWGAVVMGLIVTLQSNFLIFLVKP
jgi:ATP synthase protein I